MDFHTKRRLFFSGLIAFIVAVLLFVFQIIFFTSEANALRYSEESAGGKAKSKDFVCPRGRYPVVKSGIKFCLEKEGKRK